MASINPFYTNMFSHYMYLAAEARKYVNPFVDHVLSDEWEPCHYWQQSGFANQSKEKDVEKDGAGSEETTLF